MLDFAWYDWASLALLIFVTVINWIRGGKSAKTVKEEFMKFRDANYRADMSLEDKDKEAQSFNPLITQYRLNERTNQLEELPDKLDIKELIKSELHTALEPTLARLMPDEDEDDKNLALIDTASDDLDALSEMFEVAEDYRDRLGLDPSVSVEDVFKHIQEYRDGLSDKLKKATVEKEFKEVKTDVETEKKKIE